MMSTAAYPTLSCFEVEMVEMGNQEQLAEMDVIDHLVHPAQQALLVQDLKDQKEIRG